MDTFSTEKWGVYEASMNFWLTLKLTFYYMLLMLNILKNNVNYLTVTARRYVGSREMLFNILDIPSKK